MRISRRLILIVFIESFTTMLVQRGIYFFCDTRLGFSDELNLWLALCFGAVYVVAAVSSRRVSARMPERSLVVLTVAAALGIHVLLALSPTTAVIFTANAVLAAAYGMKWPVLESYFVAGHTPRSALRVVGHFNFSWASAVPLGVAVAGPAISLHPAALFVLAAALNAVTLLLIAPLPARPKHLPEDHPERPTDVQLGRYRSLMISSRWLLLAAYASMLVLGALMPGVFRGLGCSVASATSLAGLLDVFRLVAFVALAYTVWWHNRFAPLAMVAVALPCGFFLVLFGANLPLVLLGEAVFGLMAGLAYYAALYNAMVVKNAAVDAGSGHEGLIGMGFAIGPAAALLGLALEPVFGSKVLGALAGIGPLFIVAAIGAFWQEHKLAAAKRSQE